MAIFDLAELLAGDDNDRSQLDDTVARRELTIAIDIDELDADAARLALEAAEERLHRRVRRAAELPQRHRRVEPLQQPSVSSLTSLRPDAVRSMLHGLYQTTMLSSTSTATKHATEIAVVTANTPRGSRNHSITSCRFQTIVMRTMTAPAAARSRPVRSHCDRGRGADEGRRQQQRAGNREIAAHVSSA